MPGMILPGCGTPGRPDAAEPEFSQKTRKLIFCENQKIIRTGPVLQTTMYWFSVISR